MEEITQTVNEIFEENKTAILERRYRTNGLLPFSLFLSLPLALFLLDTCTQMQRIKIYLLTYTPRETCRHKIGQA